MLSRGIRKARGPKLQDVFDEHGARIVWLVLAVVQRAGLVYKQAIVVLLIRGILFHSSDHVVRIAVKRAFLARSSNASSTQSLVMGSSRVGLGTVQLFGQDVVETLVPVSAIHVIEQIFFVPVVLVFSVIGTQLRAREKARL